MNTQMQEAINTYVEKISSDSGVLRIYLFGSHAYGKPHERSDIDLMVVIEDTLHTIKKSTTLRKNLRGHRTVPVDMLVNRISDFEKSQTSPSIQKTIKEQGILLYERDLHHMGELPWGHELTSLRMKCVAHDENFDNTRLVGHCEFLEQFNAARYADFNQDADSQIAKRAINSARRVFNFTAQKLNLGDYIKDDFIL